MPLGEGGLLLILGRDADDASLSVLDAASGGVRARVRPDTSPLGFCGSGPAASNGMVFLFGCGDYLHAYRIR